MNRITVTMHTTDHATVLVTPSWWRRLLFGDLRREFDVERGWNRNGGLRWYVPLDRAYLKPGRISDAITRAWWALDLAEKRAAVKRTLDRKADEMREQIRAM